MRPQYRALAFKLRQLEFELAKAIAGGGILLFFECLTLDFEPEDLSFELVDFFGTGINFHPELGSRFVHEVDRLIREEAIGDVTIG